MGVQGSTQWLLYRTRPSHHFDTWCVWTLAPVPYPQGSPGFRVWPVNADPADYTHSLGAAPPRRWMSSRTATASRWGEGV